MAHVLDPERLGDHVDRLYRAALALCGSREEAEDLVQDTYARVLARPRFLRGADDLGYLLSVLRNTFLTRRRDAGRRAQSAPLEAVEAVLGEEPRQQSVVEAGEVLAVIAGLSEDFRDVLVAVDVAGLSYREAAATLKVPEGTIMSRLYRARQQVARQLGL